MYCTGCGHENADGTRFCVECGKPLDDNSQVVQETHENTPVNTEPQFASPAIQAGVAANAQHQQSAQGTSVLPVMQSGGGVSSSAYQPVGSASVTTQTNSAGVSNSKMFGENTKKLLVPLIIIVAVALIAIIVCAIVLSGVLGGNEIQSQTSNENQDSQSGAQSTQVIGNAEKSEHTVVFETNGGTTYDQIDIKAGDVITSPVEPVRYGYTFTGWYLNSACTNRIKFPYTVKQDDPAKLIIYAGWKDSDESGYDDGYDDGIFPQSSTEYLDDYDVSVLDKDEIQRAINEIYARNGYIFQKSKSEKRYFESQPWYHGTEKDMGKVRSKFNKYELANEKLLTRYRSYYE